jgi:uncharacterized protein
LRACSLIVVTRERPIDPRRLDLPLFCRQGEELQGDWPQDGFDRLQASLEPLPGDRMPPPVAWRAQGTARPVTGGEPELWLHLRARTQVVLQCQRCLQPTTVALQLERRLRFVRGEDEAARLDEESEDDVLALQARTDLHDLLEDELILALPLVPMHEHCPQPLERVAEHSAPSTEASPPESASAAEAGDDKPPHPFAALAALRKSPKP